jgi:hypothetical protein
MEKSKILSTLCSLAISDVKKAEKLYTLVSEEILSESEVIQYLVHKDLGSTLECFCSIDIGYPTAKRKKPQAVSGSEWTDNELNYYNVSFIEVNPEKIVKIKQISGKAAKFLENNKYLTPATFAEKKGIDLASMATTEFQKYMLLVLNNPSKESCVDSMFESFMKSILDDRFLVQPKYDMKLHVCHTEKKATADLVAILFPQLYIGVIVVEDKPRETSKTNNQWENTEAQIVAEAIAIAQQERWPVETPIFMFRVMEIYISVYKAVFTHEFTNSVRNGIKRTVPLEILKYAPRDPTFEGQIPGCNLLDPLDRELLTSILYSISEEIKERKQYSPTSTT